MWGLNGVWWLNAGTENDHKKILEAQRNLILLYGGYLKVLQTILILILQYVDDLKGLFQPKRYYDSMFVSDPSIF